MTTINQPAQPVGILMLQTLAMPRDTGPDGDISGGWLISQMDLAAGIHAKRTSKGRIAMVASGRMAFLRPVPVGSLISFYTNLLEVGRTSMHINIEVWINCDAEEDCAKVTEGDFVYVAISEEGKTRPIDEGEYNR